MSNVYDGINVNRRSGGLFIDIKKAFVMLDHEILIGKMQEAGIRGITLKWFQRYLSKRSQCVREGSYFSDYKTVTTGVPQGSVLGPILFLVYVNSKLKGKMVAFADDVALSYSGLNFNCINNNIQNDLYFLRKWFDYNGRVKRQN
jgi:hypothetical protein